MSPVFTQFYLSDIIDSELGSVVVIGQSGGDVGRCGNEKPGVETDTDCMAGYRIG
jgi:hypothetical protein